MRAIRAMAECKYVLNEGTFLLATAAGTRPVPKGMPMTEIAGWLEGLGLSQYSALFAQENLTLELLPDLSDEDLKGLGIPLGHRLVILKAARLLPVPTSVATAGSGPRRRNEPSPRGADRRPLTVMFCDLADSVPLSRHFGAEEFRSLLNTYRELCVGPIRRYGGFTARYAGDGIMIYFGYPSAHEDDAARALWAGLEILACIAERDACSSDRGPKFAVHIGVSTSEVVVGDIISGDTAEAAAVTGDAPNLAARLQSLAAPGTMLIDRATRELAGELFDYRSLGSQRLKGFEQPVAVWQVAGDRPFTRFEARSRPPTQLVGRKSQLKVLYRQWGLARAGQGQVTLISGEAGIGKSRLIDAARRHAIEEARRNNTAGPLAIRLQCSPFHINTPFYPITRAIGRLAEFERADDARARLAKLQVLLDRWPVTGMDNALAVVADLMGVAHPQGSQLAATGSRERRLLQLEMLQYWLKAVAKVGPVLLAIEDVQWIDPTSQHLLSRLIGDVHKTAMLIAATLRTEGKASESTQRLVAGAGADWLLAPGVEILDIDELSDEETRQLITEVAGARQIPQAVIAAISDKALGNPLHIEELTRGWLDAMRTSAKQQPGSQAGDATEVRIPESLSSALIARVDQLGPAKEVALRAAVVGSEFTADLLSALGGQRPATVRASLNMLVRAGVLRPITGATEPTYGFTHALVQEAAYGSLLASHRKDLHLKVAMALEEARATRPDVSADIIAQHYAKSHWPGKAIRLWKEAAGQAVAKSAHDEAARMLDCALALIDDLAGPERLVLELDLTAASAAALRSVRGYAAPVVEARYLRARELCGKVDAEQMRFYVDWGLFQCYFVKGQSKRADEFAESLMLNASRLPDALRADAYLATGMVRLLQGDLASSREFLELAVALTDPARDLPNQLTHGQNPGIFARSNLGHTLAFLGFADRARKIAMENIQMVRARQGEPSQLYTYINALTFASRIFLLFREADAVNEMSQELLQLARRSHYAYYEAIAEAQLGWAMAERGSVQAGIDAMQAGIAAVARTGTKLATRGFRIHLAELYIKSRNSKRALSILQQIKSEHGDGSGVWDAEIMRVQGQLSLLEGERSFSEAEEWFNSSLTLARNRGLETFELRSSISYAHLLRMTKREGDAVKLLSICLSRCSARGETRDVAEAKSIIQKIERGGSNGSSHD
jgi:class 3 adenylate cyclase/tetratricopeptide (TPR) repeat protein